MMIMIIMLSFFLTPIFPPGQILEYIRQSGELLLYSSYEYTVPEDYPHTTLKQVEAT